MTTSAVGVRAATASDRLRQVPRPVKRPRHFSGAIGRFDGSEEAPDAEQQAMGAGRRNDTNKAPGDCMEA